MPLQFNTDNKTIQEYIKSDCFRYTGKCDKKTIRKLYRSSETFRWQVTNRMCHGLGLTKIIGLLRWKTKYQKKETICLEAQIGYGLYIGHGVSTVIINPTAIIGDNCNLSQFTTIGSNHNHAATIGNNVYIGPHTCIIEDVHIGDNVTIGAGSVVTKDIPDNATAAGNYAKVLNYYNPKRYINNPWPVQY